jgi:putative RNA 2'-phosphotransferase
MTIYKTRLSKFLSYVLRHAPDRYELELDESGYAPLGEVLGILKERFKHFREEDLFELVKDDEKGRFEITGKRIRATYGHSVDVEPASESVVPPEVLYHGTSEEGLETILAEGLKPMGRRFVHLSLNERDAHMVGLRHSRTPVILEVMAVQADLDGIKFYKEGKLFLAKHVPAEYIKVKTGEG